MSTNTQTTKKTLVEMLVESFDGHKNGTSYTITQTSNYGAIILNFLSLGDYIFLKQTSKSVKNRLEQTIKQKQLENIKASNPLSFLMSPAKTNKRDEDQIIRKQLVDFAIREAFCIICPQYQAFIENLTPMVNHDKIQGVIDENLR